MAAEIDIDQMTLEEKLRLVDELWLSMKSDLGSLSVSSSEKELLDKRWQAFLDDPSSALTLNEFQQRMKAVRS
ncbi:MAG TPA: addiction module protein [Pyrinomonadaceae bacterium]|nr:addiction module protein [Pyrinomonadaceae bacterium]